LPIPAGNVSMGLIYVSMGPIRSISTSNDNAEVGQPTIRPEFIIVLVKAITKGGNNTT